MKDEQNQGGGRPRVGLILPPSAFKKGAESCAADLPQPLPLKPTDGCRGLTARRTYFFFAPALSAAV